MSLSGAIVAVLSGDPVALEGRAASLRSVGATVLALGVEDALEAAPDLDAVLLDVGAEPERFVDVARVLAGSARTEGVPVVVAADARVELRRVAALGALVTAPSEDEAVRAALSRAIAQSRRLDRHAEELRHEAHKLSHDGRVLAGLIVGYGANLRDGVAGPMNTIQGMHVERILQAATDLGQLFDRFSEAREAAAVGGAPAQAPQVAPVRRALHDIAELVHGMAQLFAKIAGQHTLSLEVDAGEPVHAWCDAAQLKQAVANLLVNAVKFTPTGGKVSVAVHRADAPDSSRERRAGRRGVVEILVADTGPGVPAADRERIFQPGARLERDTGIPGTGQGLATVREIVAAHRGEVRVEDAPGGGALFILSFPLDLRGARRSVQPEAGARE